VAAELTVLCRVLRWAAGRGGNRLAERPCVLFLDELDAIGSDNEGILVLAATNAPWDLDEALNGPAGSTGSSSFPRRIGPRVRRS